MPEQRFAPPARTLALKPDYSLPKPPESSWQPAAQPANADEDTQLRAGAQEPDHIAALLAHTQADEPAEVASGQLRIGAAVYDKGLKLPDIPTIAVGIPKGLPDIPKTLDDLAAPDSVAAQVQAEETSLEAASDPFDDTGVTASQPQVSCESDFIPYVGFWTLTSDGAFRAAIRTDGSVVWMSCLGQLPLQLNMRTDGVVEMMLDQLYTGRLEPNATGARDNLVWSDGEVWTRGFEAFVGTWNSKETGAHVSDIFADGTLRWNVGFEAADLQLRLRASGGLEMDMDRVTHYAFIVDEELRWSDGESWVHSVVNDTENNET